MINFTCTAKARGRVGISLAIPSFNETLHAKENRSFGLAAAFVIFIGTPAPILLVETTRRLRHLQIPTIPAAASPRDTNKSL